MGQTHKRGRNKRRMSSARECIRMRRLLQSVGFAILSAAALSCAAVQDPFPNQPGVLSPEELGSAARAVQQVAGGEQFSLAASGRRDAARNLLAYAVFAAPLTDFSSRVKTRRQVVCNFLSFADKWQCLRPHDEFRMTANGITHVFSYQILQGSGNRQEAVDAADFMYSKCFEAQLAGVGVKPFTPSADVDYVNTILDDGTAIRVMTGPLGDGSSYWLQRTDRKADGCGFKIASARMVKQETAARAEPPPAGQQAPRAEQQEKPAPFELTEKAAAERARVKKEREDALARESAREWAELVAREAERSYAFNRAMGAALVVALLAVVLPWVLKPMLGVLVAALIAVVLAVAATVLFSLAGRIYGEALEGSLPISLPVLLLSWVSGIGFLGWAFVRQLRGKS